MLHSQPLDWEVVESHTVAPVQVLFKDDGVKIRQIAPNAISGSYTFDMTYRTKPPAPHPHPKGAAAEVRRPRPMPISDPITSTNESADTTPYSPPRSPKKLHRKSQCATAYQPGARAISNPFNFGIQKRTTPSAFTTSKSELHSPESKPERRRSFGSTFSLLQPWHGRNRLGSSSSTSSTTSGASTSGSEDGSGSELVPAVRKEQLQTSTTDHSTGPYFPSVRLEPPFVSNNDPTTPPDFEPPSPPTLAQPGYHKAQTKKVLKHARAELMKEVRKAGYNVLVVEGWELTVFRQMERYRIKVVYRARPAVALSDSVEGMQVSCSPPYLSVLNE